MVDGVCDAAGAMALQWANRFACAWPPILFHIRSWAWVRYLITSLLKCSVLLCAIMSAGGGEAGGGKAGGGKGGSPIISAGGGEAGGGKGGSCPSGLSKRPANASPDPSAASPSDRGSSSSPQAPIPGGAVWDGILHSCLMRYVEYSS